jgi:hypothetical protein
MNATNTVAAAIDLTPSLDDLILLRIELNVKLFFSNTSNFLQLALKLHEANSTSCHSLAL